ncbi:MAG TPA: NTP transferase domain-containing protein [bacterium]
MRKTNSPVKQALILAAGLGSRLLDQTRALPKALLEVNERPILDYQLEALYDNGIRKIYIVVGYQGEKIRQHVHQFWANRMNVSIIENEMYRSSSSSLSFWLASDYLGDAPYLHINCDLIFSSELVARLVATRQHNVIVFDRQARLADNMELVTLGGNRIQKMQRRFKKRVDGKAFGLAKFSPKTVNWLQGRIQKYFDGADSDQHLFGLVAEAIAVRDFYVLDAENDLILEVNTKSDLDAANRVLADMQLFTDFHFNSKYFRAAIGI